MLISLPTELNKGKITTENNESTGKDIKRFIRPGEGEREPREP